MDKSIRDNYCLIYFDWLMQMEGFRNVLKVSLYKIYVVVYF